MARALTAVATAVVAFVSFSGCLDGEGKAFDALAAPQWSAGHSWTYRLTESVSGSAPEEGTMEEQEEGEIVLTVINTTQPLDGEPVYYVQVESDDDGHVDHPFFVGELMAYAQDDLRLVGQGSSFSYYPQMPEPSVDDTRSHDYEDPCEGRGYIEPLENDATLPAPRFPLTSGARRGTWSPDGDEFAFDYVLDVGQLSGVETEAGSFEAIHISLAMSPSVRGAPDGMRSFRVTGDYWYAPSVEQYVRMDLVAIASGGFPGEYGTFRFESRAELVDFELDDVPESLAPAYQPSDMEYSYTPLRIVSDVRLPQNVAERPVQARFALDHASPDMTYAESVQPAEGFPPASPFDAEKYTVYWFVRSPSYEVIPVKPGPVLSLEMADAGQYYITAQVRPLDCGLPWLGNAATTASNYWERTWTLDVDPGPARLIHIDEFDIASPPWSTRVSFSASGTGLDEGHLVLTDPHGEETRAWEGEANPFYWTGHWLIGWQAYGREVPNLVQTPAVGDDVTVTLRLDYGADSTHHFH